MITDDQKQKYGCIITRIQLRQLLEEVACGDLEIDDAHKFLDGFMAQGQCRQAEYIIGELKTISETMAAYTKL